MMLRTSSGILAEIVQQKKSELAELHQRSAEIEQLAYARGRADLGVLDGHISDEGYVHGPVPTSIDAGIYGFIANIYFYDIDTELKRFVLSRPKLVRHCLAIHAKVMQE